MLYNTVCIPMKAYKRSYFKLKPYFIHSKCLIDKWKHKNVKFLGGIVL